MLVYVAVELVAAGGGNWEAAVCVLSRKFDVVREHWWVGEPGRRGRQGPGEL